VDVLCDLAPEYVDDLLGQVDQPLRILHDESVGRDFLGCDYNRDGDSFRSPWTDTYIPPAAGAPQPSQRLRQLEIQLNAAFDTYRDMYFEGGVSSVYLWDLDEDPVASKDMAFAGCVLVKKGECECASERASEANFRVDSVSMASTAHESVRKCMWKIITALTCPVLPEDAGSGSWDSLHVFECLERGRTAKYKLTSTVILELGAKTKAGVSEEAEDAGKGDVKLSGSVTRQVSRCGRGEEGCWGHTK
jgi:capping protein beta